MARSEAEVHAVSGSFNLSRRLAKLAMMLGCITILSSFIIGGVAYLSSKSVILRRVAQDNLRMARSIANYADHYNRNIRSSASPEERLSELQRLCRQIETPRSHSFLCVVTPSGKMEICTATPTMIGKPIGDLRLGPGAGEGLKTIGDLLVTKQDWAGQDVNIAGQRQLVGFTFSEPLNRGVMVHFPVSKIDSDINRTALPWSIGLIVIAGVMIPMSLGLLHRSYASAQQSTDIAARKLVASERRCRAVVEDQTEWIVRWKLDGTRTFVNSSYCEFFGFSMDEAIGTSFFSLIDPDDLADVQKRLDALTPDEPMSSATHRSIRADGSTAWTEWTNRALFDAAGTPVEYQSVGRDVTPARKVEESLRRSEARFRLAVHGALSGIWEWDVVTGQVYCSPRLFEQLGYRPDEMEPAFDMLLEHLHPDDHEHLQKAISQHHTSNRPYQVNMRLRQKGGDYRWFRSRGATEFDETGNPVRMAGSLEDIHDQILAEEELRNSERELRLITDSLPVFIAYVDCEERFQYVNATCQRWWKEGIAFIDPDAVGRHIRDVLGDTHYEFVSPYLEQVRLGESVEFDAKLVVGHGETHHRHTTYVPDMSDEGEFLGFYVLTADVTERVTAELESQQTREAMRLVLEGTARATGTEFFNSLVGHLAEALGFRYVLLARVDEGKKTRATSLALWANGSLGNDIEYELAGTPCQNVVQQSMCFYPDHIQQQFPDDALLLEMGAESYLGTPLVGSAGETLGLLAALDDRPMDDRPDDRAILEIFANRAAVEIERIAAEEAQCESQANLTALIETTTDSIVSIDRTYRILTFNSAFQERARIFWGIDFRPGMYILEQVPPDIAADWKQRYDRALDGERFSIEKQYEHDGAITYSEVRFNPIVNDGVVTGVSVFVRDISERKKTAESLRNRLEFETLLSKISSTLINLPAGEIDRKIDSCLGSLAEFMDVDRALITALSEDNSVFSVEHEWTASGIEPSSKQHQTSKTNSIPWAMELWSRGDATVIPNVSEIPDEFARERSFLQEVGIRSSVTVPMVVGGNITGAVAFNAVHSERDWPDDLVNQLKLVGEIFANALMRKRADEVLQASEQRYRAVVEDQIDFIVRWQPGGVRTFVNDAYCRYFGQTREELTDTSFFQLISDEDRARVMARLSALTPASPVSTDDHRVFLPDGSVAWQQWTDRALFDDDGQLVAYQSVGRDITKQKKAEHRLRESEEQLRELNVELEKRVVERTVELQQANEDLEAYARSVTHDLRAPVRAMEGFATALAGDYGEQLDDRGRNYIQRIETSAQRMDLLIEDLLAYSRLGRSELPLRDVALDIVVREVLDQLHVEIANGGAVIDVADDLPTVSGHRATLVQIVANLVSNAIKFVAQGMRAEVRIWMEKRSDDRVRLWVEDNGIGIDDENQDRIFRTFERLHGIESYSGTGIGLAIVARACNRLGGHCGVESELERGSRFWVELTTCGKSYDSKGLPE